MSDARQQQHIMESLTMRALRNLELKVGRVNLVVVRHKDEPIAVFVMVYDGADAKSYEKEREVAMARVEEWALIYRKKNKIFEPKAVRISLQNEGKLHDSSRWANRNPCRRRF